MQTTKLTVSAASHPQCAHTYTYIAHTLIKKRYNNAPFTKPLFPFSLTDTHACLLACLHYLYRKYKMYSKTEKVTLQNITE